MVVKLRERMLGGPGGVERPFTAEEMIALAKSVDIDSLGIDEFRRFKPGSYQRNRVHLNEHFELVVLCWEPGQSSSIHDHGRSNCLYLILDGSMEEDRFELDADGEPQKTGSKVYGRGGITLAPGHLIHRINNNTDARLVTLHIYSPPLDEAVTHYTPVPTYLEE